MNPTYRGIIEKAIIAEEKQLETGSLMGWEYHEVNTHWGTLQKMMREGLIEVIYKSNKHTCYALKDREGMKKMLGEYQEEMVDEGTYQTAKLVLPDEAFDIIEGYDDVKFIVRKIIRIITEGGKPVHLMFVGPPATAKSLFLMDLEGMLEGFEMFLGGGTSAAGLKQELIDKMPLGVGIDEVDKMDAGHYEVLLSLCESGRVKIDVHGRHQDATLDRTFVIACANRIHKVPPEVKSRFMLFHFKKYSVEEFRNVVLKIVHNREGHELDVAKAICDTLVELGSRDPRDAIKLARLSDSVDDVKRVAKIMEKYGSVNPRLLGG